MSNLEVRIQQLENEVRELKKRVEELEGKIKGLPQEVFNPNDLTRRVIKDIEREFHR